jgi:hypothetical protein
MPDSLRECAPISDKESSVNNRAFAVALSREDG